VVTTLVPTLDKGTFENHRIPLRILNLGEGIRVLTIWDISTIIEFQS
jgi:hypothetical protein